MKTSLWITLLCLLACLGAGCMGAQSHRNAVSDNSKDRLTAGKVQREIKVGMSSAEVVDVLGSPNLVSTDEKRREVWVYDKISTESVVSTSAGGVGLLLLGYVRDAGASSTSQKTLTVIIKFDEQSKVRDFAYRQSSF